jgi:hypothetical protein
MLGVGSCDTGCSEWDWWWGKGLEGKPGGAGIRLGVGAGCRLPCLASRRWMSSAVEMTSPHFWRVYSFGVGLGILEFTTKPLSQLSGLVYH